MGRISVFMRDDCRFCEETIRMLRKCTAEVLADLEAKAAEAAAAPDAATTPPRKPEIEITLFDVGKDPARAAQCVRLSGAHTVPQVFFNATYVGNASQCCGAMREAEAKRMAGAAGGSASPAASAAAAAAAADPDCDEDLFLQQMIKMANEPAPNFPPRPDAAMVKVTEEFAFSAQPSRPQLQELRPFGFKSVLNVSPLRDIVAEAGGGKKKKTKSSTDDSKAAEESGDGASKDAGAEATKPRAGSLYQRQAEEERICREAGLAYVHYPPKCCKVGMELADRLPDEDETHAGFGSGAVDGAKSPESTASSARSRSRSSSDTDALVARVGGDGGVAVSLKTGSDKPTRSLLREDASTADTTGGEAGSADADDCDCWTADYCRRAIAQLNAMPRPVLIHSDTGLMACALTLVRVALQVKANPSTVYRWGRDLGHDLHDTRDDVRAMIETVLNEAAAKRAAAAAEAALKAAAASDAGTGADAKAAAPERASAAAGGDA